MEPETYSGSFFICTMQQLNILYIGREETIKDTVVRLINNTEQWTATGVTTDEQAIQAWENNSFDIALLGNGISPESEMMLCAYFRTQKENVVIIQHYGGGSGLLYNEIMEAMNATP